MVSPHKKTYKNYLEFLTAYWKKATSAEVVGIESEIFNGLKKDTKNYLRILIAGRPVDKESLFCNQARCPSQ